MEVKPIYETDTKRFHRYVLRGGPVVGVLYVPKSVEVPRELHIELVVEKDK